MLKVLCIIGPTAVGKTALSVSVSKLIPSVIISADSIQVYKGLDIVSGKDKEILSNTPHFLLDIVPPDYSFNISEYLEAFEKVFANLSADVLPVIVGGTGFYISALLDGIDTIGVTPDNTLRMHLHNASIQDLQKRLLDKNPEKFRAMNNSDRNNPRRLIRALEISKTKGIVYKKNGILQGYNVFILGLTSEKKILDIKIDKRVEERVKNGAIQEVQELFKNYEKLPQQIKRANGYQQLFGYLQGNYSFDEAVQKWKIAEHQNAKKQMTFFKKMKDVKWFNVDNSSVESMLKYIQGWYNE